MKKDNEPKRIAIIPVKMMHEFTLYDRVLSTMEKVAADGRKRNSYLKPYIKYDSENRRFVASNGATLVVYENCYLEELPQGDAYYVYEDGLLQQVEFSPKIQTYSNYERFLNQPKGNRIKQLFSNVETNSEALFTLTNNAMHKGVFLAGRQMLLLTKIGNDLLDGTMYASYKGELNDCTFNSDSIPGLSVTIAGVHVAWGD